MFKRWFKKKSCFFCKSSQGHMRPYYTLENEKISVCEKCLEYAERRAFRKG